MIPTQRECPTCKTPLTGEALYCAVCGLATPTTTGNTEGRIEFAELPHAEAESRQRLQLALGDGYEVRELLGRGDSGWSLRLLTGDSSATWRSRFSASNWRTQKHFWIGSSGRR